MHCFTVADEGSYLAVERIVKDVTHEEAVWDNGVEHGCGCGVAGVVFGDVVVHDGAGGGCSTGGDVVVVTADAGVGFEEDVPVVGGVPFDVEVREPVVVDVVEEGDGLVDDLWVVFDHDGCGDSQCAGRVFFEEDSPCGGEGDVSSGVAVSGEGPHLGFVAGDELLDEEGALVAGGDECAKEGGEFFFAVDVVDFFLAGEVDVEVFG